MPSIAITFYFKKKEEKISRIFYIFAETYRKQQQQLEGNLLGKCLNCNLFHPIPIESNLAMQMSFLNDLWRRESGSGRER